MRSPCRVLFLCTGNACRSQMAEALLRHLGGDRFVARSAGSDPAGFIHPLASETLQRLNVPMEGQCSKSWHAWAGQENDAVITLCDHAADQPCPVWPGHPATAHWGLPDPVFHPGPDEHRLAAAAEVAEQLQQWIRKLIALPLTELTPEQLQAKLRQIPQG
jgi:arsenate reductase